MTDYWVSRERHFCNYCNVWMQGDKLSVRHHEQGAKHKNNVQQMMKNKRKEKSDAAHSQRELEKQLREIEQAAQAKFAQDITRTVPPPPPMKREPPPPPPRTGSTAPPPPPPPRIGSSVTSPLPHPPLTQTFLHPPHTPTSAAATEITTKPPPPPLRSISVAPPHSSYYAQAVEDFEKEEQEEVTSGVYAIRGIVYLEGKHHEEKLVTGSSCQIWVEDADEWLEALIATVAEHPIPNTDLTLRRYHVTYLMPNTETPLTEPDVRSDRLRIKLPEGTTIEQAEAMVDVGVPEQMEQQTAYEVDQDTGIGEWSTVSVVEIDESMEAIAARKLAEEREECKRVQELEKERKLKQMLEDPEDDTSASLTSTGGTYKGIKIDDFKPREEEIQIKTSGSVDFKKKRKKNSDKSKTKRTKFED